MFHIQPGCLVSGSSWTLRGHFRRSSPFTWQLSIIKVWPLNLTHLIPSHVLKINLASPAWKPLSVIPDIKLDELTKLPDTEENPINWDTYTDHLPRLNSTLVPILIVFGVIVTYLVSKPVCSTHFSNINIISAVH